MWEDVIKRENIAMWRVGYRERTYLCGSGGYKEMTSLCGRMEYKERVSLWEGRI